ncbi:unnamed protein product [Allacma fusca]|uniref:glutathione-specific gamma-glutamylcyclotransferase n=1 Tax=Allacma fusca TaxID=39272 RepID=A0A8J2J2P2_9HEXA|nr:unnamed protein product [Allacma fusca]
MWIFGYGSLVWKADFPYVKKIIGYIKGYERKFWQASIDHRGNPQQPGRVVTLIPSQDPESRVWGVAYEIDNTSSEAQKHLNQLDEREKRFEKIVVQFYLVMDVTFAGQNELTSLQVKSAEIDSKESLESLAYIANPNGPLFLGEAPVQVIAQQVARAARVWGAAYKIHPRDVENVVKHLDMREVMGYEKTPVDFHPLPHHSLNLFDVQTSSSTSIIAESISNSSMNGYSKTNGENTNNGVGVSNGCVNITSSQPNLSNGKISNGKESDIVHQKGTTDNTKNGFIYPQSSSELDSDEDEKINDILEGIVTGHFRVTMYYGNSENAHFVGPAPIEEMASQIYASSGPSGTNKEYLFNLADAMRQICEDAIDPHLAELEMRVRKLEISLTKRKSGRSTPIEL